MKKIFDSYNRRLLYINHQADAKYWDTHWNLTPDIRNKLLKIRKSFVSKVTSRFLKPDDGPILEGGCGTAIHVATLQNLGYKTVGLDYAPQTVQQLNEHLPELDIRLGDVRSLPFEDGYFSGYWSIGVIEHFFNGFDPIALEMSRVIRHEGLLFLTFPYMSLLRRAKARLKMYQEGSNLNSEPEGFYQFALDIKKVVSQLEKVGFSLIWKHSFAGLKGFKDEVDFLNRPLQYLYDYKGRMRPINALGKVLDITLSSFAGHSILLVMRLKNNG